MYGRKPTRITAGSACSPTLRRRSSRSSAVVICSLISRFLSVGDRLTQHCSLHLSATSTCSRTKRSGGSGHSRTGRRGTLAGVHPSLHLGATSAPDLELDAVLGWRRARPHTRACWSPCTRWRSWPPRLAILGAVGVGQGEGVEDEVGVRVD